MTPILFTEEKTVESLNSQRSVNLMSDLSLNLKPGGNY